MGQKKRLLRNGTGAFVSQLLKKTDNTDKAKLVFPNGAVIEEDINNTDDVSKISFNSAAKALRNLPYDDKKIYINMLLDAFFKGENDERESKNKNI